jgi:hypothetical protein
MSSSVKHSYLIVGAGVFGVSTAYYLIKKYPTASVTIVDRDAYDADSRVAASWDWNKVVRADYDDIVYCQLGLEAQDIFETDPLWKPYFHKTGIYWICRSDYAQQVIDNYAKLGRKADLVAMPVAEAKKLYGGLFEDADYEGAAEVLVNRTSGWGAAGDCLRAVTKKCLELGVKYVTAEVTGLQIDREGRCRGVQTKDGKALTASHVVLSTGAYTPKLLELSAKSAGRADLRVGERIVAGGITTGMTKLDEKSYGRFAKMPVGVQGYSPTAGMFDVLCFTHYPMEGMGAMGTNVLTEATYMQALSSAVYHPRPIASSNGGARPFSKTPQKSSQADTCRHRLTSPTTPSGKSRDG